MRTRYPKIDRHPVWTIQQTEDDAITATLDMNPEAVRISQAVSAVTWTVDKGQASVSGEALSSNVASALITTNEQGTSLIKAKITFADGQIINQHIKVASRDTYAATTDYVS